MKKRRPGKWAASLLIPAAALGGYEWITHAFYGHGLLSGATNYAKNVQEFFGFSKLASGLTALAFTGGCFAVAVFVSPLVWRMRTLAAFAAGTILIAAGLSMTGIISTNYPAGSKVCDWLPWKRKWSSVCSAAFACWPWRWRTYGNSVMRSHGFWRCGCSGLFHSRHSSTGPSTRGPFSRWPRRWESCWPVGWRKQFLSAVE